MVRPGRLELALISDNFFVYSSRMNASAQVKAAASAGVWVVRVSGQWSIESPWPENAGEALAGVDGANIKSLLLESSGLGSWDSSLLLFLAQLARRAHERKIPVETRLPDGIARLVRMVFAVPPRKGADRPETDAGFLESVGAATLNLYPRACEFLNFLGSVTQGLGRLCVGKATMRGQDFLKATYECGAQSLPIVALTSMLFGLILAFVGAVQLTQFGAQIYVAGLVGIGMLRVMGAVMVGVVMSGRIGAAYAALIGAMQVNEEVDALTVLGISPVDFLVVPRVLALALMVPLLTLYADFMGLVGGWLVATLLLDINSLEYMHATVQMVHFKQVLIGLSYGAVFGVVIAVTSCYQGMRCGRSALAVGQTTTRAVVTAIVGIIVTTAIITVICNALGV